MSGATQVAALSAGSTATRAEPIAEADWAAALAAVRDLPADPEILLVCHLNPDGDALGSMLGCGLGLARLGLPVLATFPAPYELTPPFDQLPGLELLIDPAGAPAAPDLLICFDAASENRLGELAGRLDTAGTSIVVDHHASNTRSERRPPRSWWRSCCAASAYRWTSGSPSACTWLCPPIPARSSST